MLHCLCAGGTMNTDGKTTIAQLKEKVRLFVEEREWQQFHTPKNLSMNIVREATELMELFMWSDSGSESYKELEQKRQEVEDEVADVAFGLLNFCMRNNIDLAKAFDKKLAKTEQKYPVDEVKGKNQKYTYYQIKKESGTVKQ